MRDAVIKQLLYKSFNHEPALTPDWDTATRWLGRCTRLSTHLGRIPPIKRYAIKLNR